MSGDGPHSFGGEWTERKLELLDKYLAAYLQIFKGNPRASYFKTVFIDAFAGTGSIKPKLDIEEEAIYTIEDQYCGPLLDGSASLALRRDPPFDEYIFIEKNLAFANELRTLAAHVQPKRNVQVIPGDANATLISITKSINWKTHRAVVFLDPYGMQVNWPTIEKIAQTSAIDLWLLFPLGPVNRLLTKNAPPPPEWAAALTRIFGTDEWQDAFYKKRQIVNLFEEYEVTAKEADFDSIAGFLHDRLGKIFPQVVPKAAVLRNSTNSPLFLLTFAAANPKGAPTAVRIANHLLERI